MNTGESISSGPSRASRSGQPSTSSGSRPPSRSNTRALTARPSSSLATTRPTPSASAANIQRPASSLSTTRPTSASSSSLHPRPVSSLSTTRPTSSSANLHPRPASSLSTTRPTSSASTRPASRFSQRSASKNLRSKLAPVCQTLVTQITGLKAEGTERDADGEDFKAAVEAAIKQLETRTAASVDMSVIDRQISGHALKARINSRDSLGEALESAYKRLKTRVSQQGTDLDAEIQVSRIPDHLQFLLALSQPATNSTLANAQVILDHVANPPPSPKGITWADILAEEPFEGEHWEGILDRPRARSRDGDGRDEWDSTPSLSPLNSDDLALDDEDDSLASSEYFDEPIQRPRFPVDNEPLDQSTRMPPPKSPYSSEHRRQFEELQARQYWRDDWQTDAPLGLKFDIGNPSTLGPTVNKVFARESGFQDAQAMLAPERYINEEDLVREVLMALQGNKNIVLHWREGAFVTTQNTPRLIHLSLSSQESIISSLGRIATTVEQLRRFKTAIFAQAISRSSQEPTRTSYGGRRRDSATQTCEAFADAVDDAIRRFNSWCAAREEAMCRACAGRDEEPLVVSLLSTEKAIRDDYQASFEVLYDIVQTVFKVSPDDSLSGEVASGISTLGHTRAPAEQTASLLDILFASVQRHMERNDHVTSDALMRVFVKTAEPVWSMVGKWLKNGMGLGVGLGIGASNSGDDKELEDEFFIESSGVGVGMMGMGLLDPEFWQEGYALREALDADLSIVDEGDAASSSSVRPRRKTIPLFLEHVAELVLSTGKAVGLMRALGGLPDATPFADWVSFSALVQPGSARSNEAAVTPRSANDKGTHLFSISIDTLSALIYDRLLPHCEAVGSGLVRVLLDDCALRNHMGAIQDLFLMRKGDSMSNFIDVVFTKMDSQQPWSDFHFLNTAFNDVIDANRNAGLKEWINASLVRFSYKGGREKDQSIKRTVKAIDGLILEYAVPFPLTYIFQPRIVEGYSEVFTFLLQIRRAKSVLERILVRDEVGRGKKLKEELKVFYAMRSRLSWFINALLNFLTIFVIHAEITRFDEVFYNATSLDRMIQLHDEHLEKIRGRCLLKPKTSALHRAILSILDMALHFSEGFVTFAGDTTATLDVSRQSMIMKRHRSRRQRRQRKNVIGFGQFMPEEEDDSSSDEEAGGDVESGPIEPSYSSMSMTGNSMVSMEGEDDVFAKVERMSGELDGLVRFLRRGVESLAGGASEAAAAFGVLAFSLEDWDI